ncbi:MAG: lyase family protein [Victivallaceae bacterium]|nr:lyase family protein [Victivallaceae bacterium]MDD4180676.1 lyase family protein [Victivallaceae bacterium]
MIKLRKYKTPYPNPHDYGNWRACPGKALLDELHPLDPNREDDIQKYSNRLVYCSKTDLVWIVCLYKSGVIDRESAASVIRGLQKVLKDQNGAGGETSLIPVLDDNEDLASLINLGRTMQEPMSRLQLRDQMVDFFDYYLDFMTTIASFAEENANTIMPGHTHFSQANPITLANYALSIFDNMERGLEQLELSYKLINKNSGGCGATSGTVWPVDRLYMTHLLGFDDLLEVTYDCEASQDHTMHLMFSLANIGNTLSKWTMDIEIWGMEEIDMIRIDRSMAGVSSMMPQKCHNGIVESLRDSVSDLLGTMMAGVFRGNSEPHGDVMAMYSFPTKGIEALSTAKYIIRFSNMIMLNLHPQKDKMLEYVRQGYSCMTEVVVHLVQKYGYGGRRSHRMCAHLTRLARDRQIKAPEITGSMLDEAAAMCGEEPPGMTTAELQKCLDPVEFIMNHNNIGGPAPSETVRMVKKRRKIIVEAKERQKRRRERILAGEQLLEKELDAICANSQ